MTRHGNRTANVVPLIQISMHLWQNVLAYNRHDKPSQKKTFETFHNHLAPGSTLIHDKEQTHAKLIKALALQSTVYAPEELKGLPNKENPLEPVNRQGYPDLFSYVTNPPYDLAEKTGSLLNLVFHNPKSLRYQDFYQAKSSDLEY